MEGQVIEGFVEQGRRHRGLVRVRVRVRVRVGVRVRVRVRNTCVVCTRY